MPDKLVTFHLESKLEEGEAEFNAFEVNHMKSKVALKKLTADVAATVAYGGAGPRARTAGRGHGHVRPGGSHGRVRRGGGHGRVRRGHDVLILVVLLSALVDF